MATVVGKLENFNPLWSVKDRIGRAMIDAAERDDKINPIRSSSSPRAATPASRWRLRAAARGYKLMVTMPESMSLERRRLLKALGAGDGPHPGRRGHAGRDPQGRGVGRANKNYFMPQQFKNPANPEIHRKTTAEEIWRDTDGQVDIFVAGVGTGGTITGVGEVLKTRKPGVQDHRRRTGQQPRHYPTPGRPGAQAGQAHDSGHRRRFIPDVLNVDVIDDVVTVQDEDAMETARQLAKLEGFMCGISCGAAAWAACNWPRSRKMPAS